MGSSLKMRRVSADELQRGVPFLEKGFSATRINEVFDGEIQSGVLCGLGEEWNTINLLITGEVFPPIGPAALPVLGGAHVASFETPLDMMIWTDADSVRVAHEYLTGVEFEALLDLHRKRLGEFNEQDLRRRLQNLQRFYGLAEASHQAVVKRMYC